MRIFRRLLENVYFFFSAIFNAGIKLKYVVILCALIGGVVFTSTRYILIKNVGGQDDYDEAMRYIEIKDLIDENYIDTADRKAMGTAAASAMVNSLGDGWSYYMSADEYRTYQLSSVGEYSDIGMSIIKDTYSGGFQVLSVDLGTPAADSGLSVGMVITERDRHERGRGQDPDPLQDERKVLSGDRRRPVFHPGGLHRILYFTGALPYGEDRGRVCADQEL